MAPTVSEQPGRKEKDVCHVSGPSLGQAWQGLPGIKLDHRALQEFILHLQCTQALHKSPEHQELCAEAMHQTAQRHCIANNQ